MTIGFLNLALLAGLAALAIPPIIHFLNRRRHDVVDWGAMQFLLVSAAKRRRFMIEEYLLMALRMGLIALLVLAFAAPHVSGPLVAGLTRPPRDTVLLIDASYSMQRIGPTGESTWQLARQWCDEWLKQSHSGDRVAVLLAAEPPQAIIGELTSDIAIAAERMALPDRSGVLSHDELPAPTGNADWPRAVGAAWDLLREHGQAARRDIVIVTDRQKLDWTDAATMAQWQTLGRRFQAERDANKDDPQFAAPMIWAVTLGEAKPGPNLRMAPLQTARTVAGVGQRLRFTTALHWDHLTSPGPPKRIQLTIDDESKTLPLPPRLDGASGRFPLTFDHRFTAVGVHRVTVTVEPDDGQDVLPADNRQDLAIEVVQELPVLLIDGDQQVSAESATYFLAKAFADPADKAKVSFVVPRVVSHGDFDAAAMLVKTTTTRAVVLADVPRLTEPQLAGLTRFVEDGGGLFIFVGPRAEATFYDDEFYRDGKGLLPARLERIESVKPDQAVNLDVKRFLHPGLELFREEPNCTLGQASFTRWWKAIAEAGGRGTPVARFANDDPWLIEKTHGRGRVLLSTLPLDRSWDGHLPKTWEFPVLAHELLFALADVRSGGFNLKPGQGLRLQRGDRTPAAVTLHMPGGKASTRTATQWPFVWDNPGLPGVYHVQIGGGPRLPVIVHADSRESDLTPGSDEERRRLADLLPLRFVEGATLLDDAGVAEQSQEVWWLFLIGVIGLLCGELWLTRRMALASGRN